MATRALNLMLDSLPPSNTTMDLEAEFYGDQPWCLTLQDKTIKLSLVVVGFP